MSFAIAGAVVGVGGAIKAIDGASKAKKAKIEAEKAKQSLEKEKDMFKSLDTSNPYTNMENTMEDITVNQQEANFMKQQQMQSQANVMQQMRGAAGGSGIAALAQTLANQGALDAQKAAAGIGKQEQAIQAEKAKEAGRIQGLEREGEMISRQAEADKVTSLMAMSADELATQREAKAAAQQQMMSGITTAAGGIAGSGLLGNTVDANTFAALTGTGSDS